MLSSAKTHTRKKYDGDLSVDNNLSEAPSMVSEESEGAENDSVH